MNRVLLCVLALVAVVSCDRRGYTPLIKAGVDPCRRTEGGSTLLMTAAPAGQPEAIRILIAEGCPVDAVHSRHGDTALMDAAYFHADSTQALLEAGADVHVRDAKGETVLIRAMQGASRVAHADLSPGWDARIVQMLLDAGADPTVRDAEGRSLMQLAATTGRHRASIERILTAHASQQHLRHNGQ